MALRENHLDLMENLELESTHLLDRLVQEEVLCSADVESLRRIRNKREKNRTLLTNMATYGAKKFEKFKAELRHSNRHLYDKLMKTKTSEGFSQTGCIACKIVRYVDVTDVVDRLYKSGILLLSQVRYILRKQRCRESWKVIFRCIKSAESHGLKVLWECLHDKFPEIANDVSKETHLRCTVRIDIGQTTATRRITWFQKSSNVL